MPEKDEPFANPAAPPGMAVEEPPTPIRLTNADFRKLLMTPRATPAAAPPSSTGTASASKASKTPIVVDKAEERRKKKSYYAKLKRDEDTVMAELAKKYRDRAKERREGDDEIQSASSAPAAQAQQQDQQQDSNQTGAYRAVAPDLKSGLDAAERRRQQIQESKFLGGDMEHTHLVKGLDYALLQKVRSEIQFKELEQEAEMEKLVDKSEKHIEEKQKEEIQFKTKLGKNIFRCMFVKSIPFRNELFLPGRMAYKIELDDEMGDFDVPTTVIRSKVDCPLIETAMTLTTNDLVINKLTQVLSYLRQGRSGRKLKKKDRKLDSDGTKKPLDDSIYGDLGDYEPSSVTKQQRPNDRRRDKNRDRSKKGSYFGDQRTDEDRNNHDRHRRRRDRVDEIDKEQLKADRDRRDKERYEREKGRESNWLNVEGTGDSVQKTKKPPGQALGGYAECYPGLAEMADAIDDSDDEADYSKMDMGNKKGPVGRWDFDTQEEYSDYMNSKEAMPKAAFQYGVKMADGRKTRRVPRSEKNEKAELDKEWQKISAIIQKRKTPGGNDPSSKRYKT